jgi:hypothetical protein
MPERTRPAERRALSLPEAAWSAAPRASRQLALIHAA